MLDKLPYLGIGVYGLLATSSFPPVLVDGADLSPLWPELAVPVARGRAVPTTSVAMPPLGGALGVRGTGSLPASSV